MDARTFRAIRKLTGLNARYFALSFGMSESKVHAYESGDRQISVDDAAYMERLRDQFSRADDDESAQ